MESMLIKTIKHLNLKIKTMKKTFNSNSTILVRLKNLWFATQLAIVSVSLPVLCFVQVSRQGGDGNSKQQEQVIKSIPSQNEVVGFQNALDGKTANLN
jgi:hypothetical protein